MAARDIPDNYLVVQFRMQTRDDLEVLLAIAKLSLVRNLDLRVPSLLLRLSLLNPLLGGEMLAKLGKHIMRQPEPLKQRAVC